VYGALLDDLEWHNLQPESAKILVNCWLIGSEAFGILPELRQLAFRLRISESDVKYQLSLLSYWIIDKEVDVLHNELFANSKMLSSCYQGDISLYTEREREKEKEKEKDIDKRQRERVVKRESYPQGPICLPVDCKLTKENEEFCRSSRPDLDPQKTFEKFCAYWHAQPPSKGKRLNWSFQWRRWVGFERINDEDLVNKTVAVNSDFAKTKALEAAEDAIIRNGPSLETLAVIAKIRGSRQ
jgi:hypothetical protein